MEKIRLYIWNDFNQFGDHFYIRAPGWKRGPAIKDFCKLLGIYKPTFLKNMERYNYVTRIYVNHPELNEVFFKNEEDAINAKEWIESQLLAIKIKKMCTIKLV